LIEEATEVQTLALFDHCHRSGRMGRVKSLAPLGVGEAEDLTRPARPDAP
jgi:hypothetical protein